jgi:hypothetical protein
MQYDPDMLQQARAEILSAPFGHTTQTAQRWADIFGVAYSTMYRIANVANRVRKGAAKNPELVKWAEIIFKLKKTPPDGAGELSTEDAVASAIAKGMLSADAALINVSTYNAIARNKGWNQTTTRRVRFQAERPNQIHHFDASTSKYLYIAKRYPDNDYLLKLHRPGMMGYKNKPIPCDSLRPWYYGLVDDNSGVSLARCTAAPGESSGDSLDFLAWAWAQMGICDTLMADEGMLRKALASSSFLERIGVELPSSGPYRKEAHGKIERPWRTLWLKFELVLYAECADWHDFEITMSELNRRLQIYLEDKYNQMPHRFEREFTRRQVWERISWQGGIVKIPETALATVARRAKRKVDVFGNIELNGATYTVKGLHDAWVWVYEGVFENRLVVQDIETGKKYDVVDFKPLKAGEYQASPETPHQKLIKEAIDIPEGALYTKPKAKEKRADNVLTAPIRVQEREIDDPFQTDRYRTIGEAMDELTGIIGTGLSGEERGMVEELINNNGLHKLYVRDLAQEIRGELESRRDRKIAAAGGM